MPLNLALFHLSPNCCWDHLSVPHPSKYVAGTKMTQPLTIFVAINDSLCFAHVRWQTITQSMMFSNALFHHGFTTVYAKLRPPGRFNTRTGYFLRASYNVQAIIKAWPSLLLRFLTWCTIRTMTRNTCTLMAQLVFFPPTRPHLWLKKAVSESRYSCLS